MSDKTQGYSGKIPVAALVALEDELSGMIHGKVVLEVHIRDGRLARFVTVREKSFLPSTEKEEVLG
jgi:hypothetical protein